MGALTAALKAIFNTNNYTASTSGISSKKIPVTEINGLPTGQISMGALASVLGAGGMPVGEELSSGTNILQLTNGCYQTISGAVTASLLNRPSTMSMQHACKIFVMKLYTSDNYKNILIICSSQIFLCYAYYSSNTWRTDGWKEFTSTDV